MNKSKKIWIAVTVALIVVTNIGTYFLGPIISENLPFGNVIIDRNLYNEVAQFQKLFLVKSELEAYYSGKINENNLVTDAIKGMTNSLNDPYTVFMDQSETKAFNSEIQGQQYVGIGAQVSTKGNNIIIVAPFDGSPAQKAGIMPYDVLLKIDGTAVTAKDLDKAVAMMKGKAGTKVTLTIERQGKGTINVDVTRENVVYNTVSGNMVNNNIGYIHMSMFDENTGANFDKKLEELKKQGAKGLIIDLRDNGGGLLTDCIDVASNFVDKNKTLVYTVDKNNYKDVSYSSGGDSIGMPLVLLVNGNTASASEIFTGVVKDYKLGTIVGEKTFGKGIVQNTFDTGDNTLLKVTIAKWYTPLGENINHTGFKPDVEVDFPQYETELQNNTYSINTDQQYNKALEILKAKVK